MIAGIEYTKPEVMLLQESGIGVPEIAARTCYDSFDNSENGDIRLFARLTERDGLEELNEDREFMRNVNCVESSALLDQLAWVHHHHSIIEHTTLSYLVKGTSRGVLQEHARHRIQAISVRSTRYTMSSIINAFVSSQNRFKSKDWFVNTILDMNMFVVTGNAAVYEANHMYEKLFMQYNNLGKTEFLETCLSKDNLNTYAKLEDKDADVLYEALEAGKKKRNVGDNFKWIVTDNWKVDMVVTFNLRSLKNYFDLRDSGAAYFQIQWLAQAMKDVTPMKYLKLIDKKVKDAKVV